MNHLELARDKMREDPELSLFGAMDDVISEVIEDLNELWDLDGFDYPFAKYLYGTNAFVDHSDCDGWFGDDCGEIAEALKILMDSWT